MLRDLCPSERGGDLTILYGINFCTYNRWAEALGVETIDVFPEIAIEREDKILSNDVLRTRKNSLFVTMVIKGEQPLFKYLF